MRSRLVAAKPSRAEPSRAPPVSQRRHWCIWKRIMRPAEWQVDAKYPGGIVVRGRPARDPDRYRTENSNETYDRFQANTAHCIARRKTVVKGCYPTWCFATVHETDKCFRSFVYHFVFKDFLFVVVYGTLPLLCISIRTLWSSCNDFIFIAYRRFKH